MTIQIAKLKKHWSELTTWWAEGLMLLLPVPWRLALAPVKNRLTIECDNKQVIFRHNTTRGSVQYTSRYSDAPEDEMEISATINWLKDKADATTEIVLLLPHDKILHKELQLPSATRDNLGQVLRYEMDRQTPFAADQVYFDYHVQPGTDNGRLQIDLYICTCADLDGLIEKLKPFNLLPDVVSNARLITSDFQANLLPPQKRRSVRSGKNQVLLQLGSLASALLLAVLYAPLIQQQQTLETLQTELDHYRDKATETRLLEEQHDKLVSDSKFLRVKQTDYKPVIDLLNELSGILPDDAWVSELSISQQTLRLQGEAADASAIIEILDKSGYFENPEFTSPITSNTDGNKDKFRISARIEM